MRRLVLIAALAVPVAAQHALLVRGNDLVRVPLPGASLRAVADKVALGPDARELRHGLRTALPAGTRVLELTVRDGRARVTASTELVEALELELALEQLQKSLLQSDPSLYAIDLAIGDGRATRPLGEVLAERERPVITGLALPEGTASGALAGRVIAVSPGHGFYWHTALGWTTQRGNIGGLIEDIHTNEIAMRYLIPYLENLGARVISCRERGEAPRERIADNDAGPPRYVESGAWTTSSSTGYNGGTYRYEATRATETSTATWSITVDCDGVHPVYAWYRAGANRTSSASYRIIHSGGTSEVEVDQRRDDRTWVFLGSYHFAAADGAVVQLSNRSSSSGVVIADAVRVGAGVGSIVRGGTSGQPRWRECSRYWAEYSGAPSSVYDSISSGQDNDDDVTCRPRYAEWRGADAFLSLHTNAGGGTGTSSFIYSGGATAGSAALQQAVQSRIVADIRAHCDPTWVDRGAKQANFGEVRLLSSMPGVLVELAFHDVAGSRDHRALHDPTFRRIGARAIARGVLRYFAPSAEFAPGRPTALRVNQDGARGLRVGWEPVAGATHYTVEQSTNHRGFATVASVTESSWSTGPLPHGTVRSFRVRAHNATGRSFPTEVLPAGTSHRGVAELLLVQGFDRLGRHVKTPDNTFDYLGRHADAIADSGEFSIGFDAASNEAVRLGRVLLGDYVAVDWACGEEDTVDETFDAVEQAAVRQFVQAGGRLLVSGSEIAWDLDAQGSSADRSFYRDVLGARFVADDADSHGFAAAAAPVFEDVPDGSFDDGTHGTYDVDRPDVLAPADSSSRICLTYATGGAAGIQRTAGASRVVCLGFPIETVIDDSLRALIMARALRFLLTPRGLEAPPTLALGQTAALPISVPAHPGQVYLLAAARATSPITPLRGDDFLPLRDDGLLTVGLLPANPVFQDFFGTLDASGRARARLWLPPLPFLSGLDLYFSGFVLAQSRPAVIGAVLPWVRVQSR